MKKLIIIAAVAMAAFASQASSFSWKFSMGNAVYQPGSTTELVASQPTVYLFAAETVAQADLVSALAANKTIDLSTYTKATSTVLATTGKIGTVSFDYGDDGDVNNFYMALFVNDQLFISDSYVAAGQTGKTTTFSMNTIKANSQTALKDATAGYSTAGWYQAVPEPTSGLLLLLGMAGLALKRKQA